MSGGGPSVREHSGLWIPAAFTFFLFALSFLPRVRESTILQWSFWGAVAALAAWHVVLLLRLRGSDEDRTFVVGLYPHHYLQAVVQVAFYAYWGWYWEPVSEFVWLIVAQIAFAYAFDMLLHWSRRTSYRLGFGPFPIILSTNLFLWFRDDWFYLQFLMIAVGFLGKEFIKWQRDGRRRHIFNPSAFSLGLFSVVLIATEASGITWGQAIATTQGTGPHTYAVLFLIGLVVMYRFSITLVAGSAAATLFGLSALHSALVGVPYFLDSEIPAAVFLGLLLLITDPSTSPKEPLGKACFGVLYGVGVFALYSVLGALGVPTFYDKLLCVPLLNLSVRRIDAGVRSLRESGAWKRHAPDWSAARSNLVHIGIWILFFGAMTAMGKTDGTHTGDRLPFWQESCEAGSERACQRLVQIERTYCEDNSGWACNELGGHYLRGELVEADRELALAYFARACEARFQPGCVNLLDPGTFSRANPRVLDLRLLLREGGRNLMEMPERELYERACDHGWDYACRRIPGGARAGS